MREISYPLLKLLGDTNADRSGRDYILAFRVTGVIASVFDQERTFFASKPDHVAFYEPAGAKIFEFWKNILILRNVFTPYILQRHRCPPWLIPINLAARHQVTMVGLRLSHTVQGFPASVLQSKAMSYYHYYHPEHLKSYQRPSAASF